MAELHIEIVALQHQLWRTKLRSMLDDQEYLTEDEAVSYRDCELGKWIYSKGEQLFGNNAQFLELEKIHADFHNQVKDVVKLKNQGKINDAEAAYQKVRKLSDQVSDLLDSIGNVIK